MDWVYFSLNGRPQLLAKTVDVMSKFRALRSLARYVSDRNQGLQYGSYGLADEVALARDCLANRPDVRVVVDAGANRGEWSQGILNSCSNFEKLLSIEPSIAHRTALREFSDADPRIAFEAVAVGATSGQMSLYSDQAGSGLASLYPRELGHDGIDFSVTEIVTVTTLDFLADHHNISTVSFLKLDLEGHELEALRGASRLLNEGRVEALSFEFGGCNIDSRTYFKDFWKLLVEEHSFRLFRLLPQRRLLTLHRYSESLERFTWQNVLALRSDLEPPWPVMD